VEKNLQSHAISKREKQSDDEVNKEIDKLVKDEYSQFNSKCLDYVFSIQEFEYDWFSYFSGNVTARKYLLRKYFQNKLSFSFCYGNRFFNMFKVG
jgi:hypothetical protein